MPCLMRDGEECEAIIENAIDLIVEYGGVDGSHHKDWCLDQVIRTLAGDRYTELMRNKLEREDN